MLKLRTDIAYVAPNGKLTQAGVEAIQGQLDGQASSVATDIAALDTRVDALEALAVTAPGTAPRFVPRAWVSFAGATGVVAASGNVTSVTRTGAGNYTVNFTTAAPNTNYVPLVLTDGGTVFTAFGTRNTGSCVVNTRNNAGTLVDANAVAVAFIW